MITELLAFLGILVLGGILAVVSGVSLARLGRRGEATPQSYDLKPWVLLVVIVDLFCVRLGLGWFTSDATFPVQPILLASTAIVLASILVVFRVLGKPPAWTRSGQVRRRFTWSIRVWLVAMPGFLAVILINQFIFTNWIPWTPGPDPLLGLSSLSSSELAISGILLCLILPILEEMLFRGYLFRGLLGPSLKLSAARSLAVSSLLFALSHRPDLWLPMLYIGCLLAWIDWRSGDLRLCIMAHVAHNSFIFALALI